MSARIPAATGALLIALLVPASAQAVVTIDPLKPCYVSAETPAGPQTEGILIRATGFTPNSTVDLSLDGQPVQGGQGLQVDNTGLLALQSAVPAPFVANGTREFPLTLTEVNNPANTATATAMTAALDVGVTPRRARPSKVIRFKGGGFTAPTGVYAHYLFKGKLRKTVRMVRKTNVCGGWTAHRQQIPVKRPKAGLWTIQFDQSKRYRDATDPTSGFDGVSFRVGISVTFVRRPG